MKEINIPLYIILCIITFGFFYFIWQYKQMNMCNQLLGMKQHSFFKWFFLSLITFGLYHFYHEYQTSVDIIEIQSKFDLKQSSQDFPMLCLIVSIFGLFLISDIVHQEEMNKIIRAINADPSKRMV